LIKGFTFARALKDRTSKQGTRSKGLKETKTNVVSCNSDSQPFKFVLGMYGKVKMIQPCQGVIAIGTARYF